MILIKQSTAITVPWGPFLDTADGFTPKTALTIQKADVRLKKNGGDAAAASADQGASDAGAPHDEVGYYDGSLNTTDTNTLGRLKAFINKTGACPVFHDFQVMPANVWDSLFGADRLMVDVLELNSDTAALLNLADAAAGMVRFTVDTTGFATTQTQFETNLTEATSNHYKDRIAQFKTGALAGQIAQVTANSLQSGRVRFTVTTMTDAPANGDTGILL